MIQHFQFYAMVGCTLPLLLKYTFNKVKSIIIIPNNILESREIEKRI